MKICEAKSGIVRYAESKAVSGENRILKRPRDEPDFWEYLSEKDRRRWIRLPDYKKERLIRKARRNAAVRGYLLKADSTGTDGENPGAERGNTKNKRPAGTASGDGKIIKHAPQRTQGSTDSNSFAGTSFRTVFRGKSGLPASGQEAEGRKKGGFKKGLAGLAASATKKTASKIAGAFKEKPEQMSGADGEMIRGVPDSAGQEIKNATGTVKRTTGGFFSLLSLIIGPFLYVIFLVIILVVVIIFMLAWLISFLIPTAALAETGGTGGISGWGDMPYYCQQDEKWGSCPYDAGTIYSYGCGPTSMAMILACLTGDYSITPITMTEYGNQDNSRVSCNTAFVADKEGYSSKPAGSAQRWWLRSPAYTSAHAAHADNDGAVNYTGMNVTHSDATVRPAIRINLKESSGLWTYAGTVNSKE